MNRKPRKLIMVLGIAVALAGWLGLKLYNMPPRKRRNLTRTYRRALHNISHGFVEYFVPHRRNNYQPRMFHRRVVVHLVLIVVLVKIGLVATLFALYPNAARLSEDIKTSMYGLVNEYRNSEQVAFLKASPYLEAVALEKANDMIAQGYFSHYGPDGKKPWEWLDSTTYAYQSMGENLAMDFLSANSVFRAFKASPSHDKNLKSANYSEIGIAVVSGKLEGHDTNLMVVFFARPKGSLPSSSIAQAAVLDPVAEQPVSAAPANTNVAPVTGNAEAIAPTQNANSAPSQPLQPVANVNTTAPNTNAVNTNVQRTPINSNAGTANVNANTPSRQLAQANTNAPVTVQRVDDDGVAEVLGESVPAETAIIYNLNSTEVSKSGSAFQSLITWAHRFLFVFLCAIILLLLVNIFVKIRVQHAPVIANAFVLILVVMVALYVNVHAAEAIGEKVRILSALL